MIHGLWIHQYTRELAVGGINDFGWYVEYNIEKRGISQQAFWSPMEFWDWFCEVYE